MGGIERRGVVPDFSEHPDLVVIYLGMRVRALAGIKTLLGFGPRIDRAGAARPEGLLHVENTIVFGLFPLHIGMRWYWRDLESLTAWARSEPHGQWWRDFLRDVRGTALWHETYHMRGGMEAVYSDISRPVGLSAFLPTREARGSMAARHRAHAEADIGHLPSANTPDAGPV